MKYCISFVSEENKEKILHRLDLDRVPAVGEIVSFASTKILYKVKCIANNIIDTMVAPVETDIIVYLELN